MEKANSLHLLSKQKRYGYQICATQYTETLPRELE